jgi:dienelactone hydrolase
MNSRRFWCATLLAVVLPAIASATHDRAFGGEATFIARVVAIEPLGERAAEAITVGSDWRYLLTFDVLDVAAGAGPIREPGRLDFAIHSPALLFGLQADELAGRSFKFVAAIEERAGKARVVSLKAMPASALEESGSARFDPAAEEAAVPELFRLPAAEFDYRLTPAETVATRIRIFEVTFPSPVVTPHEANNMVHCEYFVPVAPPQASGGRQPPGDPTGDTVGAPDEEPAGSRRPLATDGKSPPIANRQSPIVNPRPATIVLHILGGDFDLSRLFCRTLAHNGVAALFVKMPYYGPRRDPQSDRRMISVDPRETVEGMSQAIKDIRRARAWLAGREEIDAERIGVFGISLGGITAALAFTAEPRLDRACLMLAGGDIAQVGWEAPELRPIREQWEQQGGTKEEFVRLWTSIDPVTYADRVAGRRVLMLNARYDEVIPRRCTDSLWQAFGEPEIHWFDAGHYTVARFMFDGLERTTRFFGNDEGRSPNAEGSDEGE